MFTNSPFLVISEPNSRCVPRVGGYGWHKHIPKHSKHHRQRDASCTNGQVGPRPSPQQVALVCLQRAVLIRNYVMCVFARLPSKNITRTYYGVNFRALFTHP
jgi:hypothetical protein